MEEKKTIDARGLSCPQPVILVQKALKEGAKKLEIMVDTVVAKENIMRTASKAKAEIEVKQSQDSEEFVLVITKS
ncbi:MAG: sulfurtransferase TusA family protein [Candidatus Brocadiae bacterium]|nr:sulfurtransferase TusA family protein [Candidatus Brocadiia bacterium]